MTKNQLFEAALSYAKQGYAVLPLRPKSKTPLTSQGFKNASKDLQVIRQWWQKWPNANIGIATGAVSSLFVVDVDGVYPDNFPPLPALAQVETRKGFHYYFRYLDGCTIKSKAKIMKADVDVRGDGGYIVAPPSVHPEGDVYKLSSDGGLFLHDPSSQLIKFLSAPKVEKQTPCLDNNKDGHLEEHDVYEMLSFLDPDMDYGGWLQIGMAIHAGGYTLSVWDNWSKEGTKYVPDECYSKWLSFSARGGVTIATLVKMARDNGYRGQVMQAKKDSFTGRAVPIQVERLERGSEVELAKRALHDLQRLYGEVVFSEGIYWFYNDKTWAELSTETTIRRLLHDYDGMRIGEKNKRVNLSSTKIEGVLRELACLCRRTDFFKDAAIGINCNSGFITFDDNGKPSIQPHSAQHKQRFLIAANWPSECEPNLLNTLLDGCFLGDPDSNDKKNLIYELMGAACLSYATKLKAPKAFVFLGQSANNGKSQVIKLLRDLLPEEAKSSIAPAKFENPHYCIELRGKALNSCDELSAKSISSDVFKLIITGDELTGRALYQQPVSFTPKALHIFATNILPPFTSGFDQGVKRRLMLLCFNRSIPADEVIENIAQKIIQKEFDAVLNVAIKGAQNLIRNGAYTEPISSSDALREWLLESDPVRAWVVRCTVFDKGLKTEHKHAYNSFKLFAEEEGFRNIPAANLFSQRLRSVVPHYDKVRHSTERFHIGFRRRH